MANCNQSPTDVLAFLAECAETHLADRPVWIALGDDPIVLVGAEGVWRPYGCCPGLLAVESVGPIAPDPDNGPGTIDGCDEDCNYVVENRYKVTVKFCAPAFDPTRIDGAPVTPDERSQLALDLVAETWLLFQALRCCILDAGFCSCGNVLEAGHSLINGCATFWTTVRWEHMPCCPLVIEASEED